jgi:hypothetical protein
LQRSLPGPFQAAKDASKMDAAVRGAFEKLGETRLSLGAFSFRNPDARFVPVSQLNALRRDLAEQLERALDAALERRLQAVRTDVLLPVAPPTSAVRATWSIKVDRIGFLDDFEDSDFSHVDEVLIDIARDHAAVLDDKLARLAARIGREKIRLALPPVTRKWEEHGIQLKLERLRAAEFSKWEAGNVSACSYLNSLDALNETGRRSASGTDLATDWSVYVVNRAAARQVLATGAERFALSPEDGL